MKRMRPLSLIAAATLLLLQATAGAQAAPQPSQATPDTQPIIVAWDRVGTPA